MLDLRKIWNHISKRLPRKRHLRGSFLHRAVGERLFHNDNWKISRHSVAAGLAVGTIVAFTPTIGVQMFLAGVAAYFLRVNIPAAILVCWVTNPVTAPFIYPLQYRLGSWILCILNLEKTCNSNGLFSNLVHYAWPLWIGSLVSGLILSIIAYWSVFLGWNWLMKVRGKFNKGFHNIHEGLESKLQNKE